ncbi:DDRGK domain-containing protein 1-like [Paramacrobiotus metropolitanus]|uniref:DDRGK domain-containing protein 1-like n=1 Tax=Paramacrobiotus metropolitanus TaxID=2943436 RepID=UPI0024457FE4|nr:DDRGK domain-containing protein 1-like [Paramacrobiotus metropolitanus]
MDTTSIMLAIGFVVFACLAYFLSRKKKPDSNTSPDIPEEPVAQRPRLPPELPNEDEGRRAGGRRVVRNRARPQRPRVEEVFNQSGSEDEIGDDVEDSAILDSNIGAKKRRKLELKAEKRAHRQAELQEREEKKEREARIEEERKRKEAQEKLVEEERLEQERLEREERERKEHEEYLKLKESFQIEAEGEEPPEPEGENLLQEFIEYIKQNKIVLLEDLAAHFKLKTQECIDRVQKLQADGLLTGVIDDRGKFIFISMEELQAVAKFIKQRGRVSIAELAESSNKLIKLQTQEVPT